MREKARRALATAQSTPLHVQGDSAMWGVKQEDIDDDLNVFAGRKKVFRPGTTSPPVATPPHAMTGPPPDRVHATQAHVQHPPGQGESMLGEWLARQEQYVGY